MSSQAPEQSPLDKAKAEADELYQKVQHDLDSLRAAPINEFGNRIDSLQESVKLGQDHAGRNIDNALKACDARVHALEKSLAAKETQLLFAGARLRTEIERSHSLLKQLSAISAENDDAKARHDDAEAENDKAQLELKRMSAGLKEAAIGLEQAQRCVTNAQTKIRGLEQNHIDGQEGTTDVEQNRKDLSNEPVAVRKKEAEIQADVEGVDQRAPSMETKPNKLQSDLNRINKPMTDAASSIPEQSTPSQSASTSAVSTIQQDSSKESTDGVQMTSDQQQPHELPSQPARNQHMGETDRLFCEEVMRTFMNDERTEYDVQFFLASSGFAQPLNLTTIENKLDEGAYMSADSLRKDFDSMIKRYRTMKHPRSMLGKASDELKAIFDEIWFALQASGSMHQLSTTQDCVGGNSNSRGHKRKASTERPVMSEDSAEPRRPPGPSHPSNSNPQVTSLITGGGPRPALPQSKKAQPTSDQRAETGSDVWSGKVTLAPSLGFSSSFSFNAVGNLVSFLKSPPTFKGPWTKFIPTELHVQNRCMPPRVGEYLDGVRGEFAEDILVLRLTPSSESDQRNFNRLHRDLNTRRRYAQVRHGSVGRKNGGQVLALHLVPVSKSGYYPESLHELNHKLLRPKGDHKGLFLVVNFLIAPSEEEELQKALDQMIKALYTTGHTKNIVDARDRIVNHSIPLQRLNSSSISVAREFMTLLGGLPFTQSYSTLTPGYGEFLSLSYSRPGKVGDTKLPSFVFVLGRLMRSTESRGLVIVDLEHPNRPLWEICRGTNAGTLSDSLRLLRSKLPRSFQEWQLSVLFPQDTSGGSWTTAADLSVKIERCGHSG